MNDIKEQQANDLYHEFLFYSEDLDELARILVRILPRRMISRIIEKLRCKRKNDWRINHD